MEENLPANFNERDKQIINLFGNHLTQGETYTSQYLKQLVQEHNGPQMNITALTYNRWNTGMGHVLCLFEYIKRGHYKYLDILYPYSGEIYHYPRGNGGENEIIGKWIDGTGYLNDGCVFKQQEKGYLVINNEPHNGEEPNQAEAGAKGNNFNRRNDHGPNIDFPYDHNPNPIPPNVNWPYNDDALNVLKNAPVENQGNVGRNALQFGQNVMNGDLAQGLKNELDYIFNRQSLLNFCANNDHSNLSCVVAICAWGGMSYYSARNLFNSWNNLDPLITKIRKGLVNTRSEAYQSFYLARNNGKLPGCGVAYYTKFICFLNPKLNGYILDQWTGKSINLLSNMSVININNNWVTDQNDCLIYEKYCDKIQILSNILHCTPLQAEERIFSNGGIHPGSWRAYVRENYLID